MADKQNFDLENMYDRFRKDVFRASSVCVIIALTLILCANVVMSQIDFKLERELFETIAIDPLVLTENHDEAYGSSVTVGVSGYSVCGENICVDIFGRNKTDSEISATSGMFILSTFNKSFAEPRGHYYAENWNGLKIAPNSDFSYSLIFDAGDAESLLGGDYILTLSAFRNVMDRETVEVIVNEQHK